MQLSKQKKNIKKISITPEIILAKVKGEEVGGREVNPPSLPFKMCWSTILD